jgi:hypothetical protein
LRVYQFGDIAFRPIGELEQYYKLTVIDGRLQLNQINVVLKKPDDTANKPKLTAQIIPLSNFTPF